MMALYFHILLVLLASIISQYGAIEYYVKPTDFTNITCPGQPCLTINEYTDASAYYIKSNIIFIFLPGKHIVLRPIVIKNVENVSIKAIANSMDANIIAHFACRDVINSNCIHSPMAPQYVYGDVSLQACCSVIRLVNVSNASMRGIDIKTNSSGVMGITLQHSSNIQLQSNIVCKHSCGFGLFTYNSSQLYIGPLRVSHHLIEMLLHMTNRTIIRKSRFLNSVRYGLLMIYTDTVRLIKATILSYGMKLWSAKNTAFEQLYVNYNRIEMEYCTNTHIKRMYTVYNDSLNINLYWCRDTIITDMFAGGVHCKVEFRWCNNSTLLNISINYHDHTISFFWTNNTYLKNVALISTHNTHTTMAIQIFETVNTTLASVYSHGSFIDGGINIGEGLNTSLLHISVTNTKNGIALENCTNAILMNIFVSEVKEGIIVENGTGVEMDNVSVECFETTGLVFSNCSEVTLQHSSFLRSHTSSTQSSEYMRQPVILFMMETNISLRDCHFIENNITCIKAIHSSVTIQGNLMFVNNRALSGTVFYFAKNSVLKISESAMITCTNNSAINYGGVFHIITEEYYSRSMSLIDVVTNASIGSRVTSSTECFIRVEGERSKKRLKFSGNRAGKGGDIVFGGLVALGWDGNINCLDSFKNMSDLSEQSGTSVISSVPSRVCLCWDSQPECLIVADPMTHTIYPGETITIPAVIVGQDFGTVSGSVIAQLMMPSEYSPTSVIYLKDGQNSFLFQNGPCRNMSYTFYTNSVKCEAMLVMKTDNSEVIKIMTADDNHKLNYTWHILNILPVHEMNKHTFMTRYKRLESYSESTINNFFTLSNDKMVFPKEIYNYPAYINISFRSCPLGFSLSEQPPFKCDCYQLLFQMPGVTCNIQDQSISRSGSVWVGTYENCMVAVSKYCPRKYCKRHEIKLTLMHSGSENWINAGPDVQCNYNRSGILCGGCQPGLSLALGSDRCLECSNNFISLLLPCALAGFVLVLLIKVLNLTISEGTLNGLIFYANVINANRYLYYSQMSLNPMTLFIAWLNLDLGIETCFVNGLTAYGRTWLQFVFPLYIWGIATLVIILSKYFVSLAKILGKNSVSVLATLFLLSYAKLFNTCLTALSYTTLYTTKGQISVWSADGNVIYLSRQHAPLFAVAVV